MKRWSLFYTMILVVSLGMLLLAAPALANVANDDDNDDDDDAFDDDILATATYDPLTGTYALTTTDGLIQLVMDSDGTWAAVVHKKMATGSNYIDGVNFDPVVLSAIIFSPSNMLSNTFSTIDIDTGGNSNVHSSPTIYAFGNDVSPGTNVQFWQVSDVDEVLTGANWTAIL